MVKRIAFTFKAANFASTCFQAVILVSALLGVVNASRADPAAQPRGTTFGPNADVVLHQSSAPNQTDLTPLEPDKPIVRELSGTQQHSYQLTVQAGQCAHIIIDQKGIDLLAQLSADGKAIADFDDEILTNGQEAFDVAAPGTFRLTIRAKYPKLSSGRYVIRLAEVRDATERDRIVYEARGLETASRQLWNAGKYVEALPLAEKTIELQERASGTEHAGLVYPLLTLATIYYSRGDYQKAQTLCLRGLAIAEKVLGPEHQRVATLLYNLALFYNPESNYDRAEALYLRALSIQEKGLGPDHPLVAATLSDLGVVYRLREDYARTEPLFQRALRIQEKALGEDHPYVLNAVAKLAGLYRLMGDYAKAEPLYQRVVATWERANHPALAIALNNLGNLYSDMGEYEKAEPLYLRAIAIQSKAAPDHPFAATFSTALALLYARRGDYAKAEPQFLSALAILEKSLGPDHTRVADILTGLAAVYFANDDVARAEPLYDRAKSIFEKTSGPEASEIADILASQAQISAASGKLAEAVKYQARANAIVAHSLELNFAIGSERQKLAFVAKLPEQTDQTLSLQVRFAADNSAARELAAVTVIERKGLVQDSLSNSLASLRSRSTPEDQAVLDQFNNISSQLARAVLNGPQSASLSEHQKHVKDLEDQSEKLQDDITRRSAGFFSRPQPVTLAAIRSAIPDAAALIEFAVYHRVFPNPKRAEVEKAARYAAYVVRKEGPVLWAELGDAKVIDDLISRLRQALRDPRRGDVQQLARAVDEKVMRPLRPLVGTATRLLISPDGALNLVPFEALVDERDQFLVKRYACSYLTSGRDLLRLQVARASKTDPVVIANPQFGEREPTASARAGTPGSTRASVVSPSPEGRRQSVTNGSDLSDVYFAPLSSTTQEAQAIKSLFAEAHLLTGAQATETSLKGVAAPGLLHIATHGFFLTDALVPSSSNGEQTRAISAVAKIDNPLLRSGLALAGANLRTNAADDGILTALEASGLNLWGTKLVTLSACDTGLGEVRNGEGVYGLRRAFVLAGTETLVMSLWQVSDYVTREIMIEYYKGLKQGLGRGDALRQVQLAMLKRKDRQHPFYWASFIQSGEWANLDGKR